MQDLPKNHFCVSGASRVNITNYYFYHHATAMLVHKTKANRPFSNSHGWTGSTMKWGLMPANRYVYIIDQVRGQDGWILVEFSFCVFMDRDEVEVHENAKRERGQYPAILTELAWSIKDLLYGIKSAEKNDLRTCLFSSTEKEPS